MITNSQFKMLNLIPKFLIFIPKLSNHSVIQVLVITLGKRLININWIEWCYEPFNIAPMQWVASTNRNVTIEAIQQKITSIIYWRNIKYLDVIVTIEKAC